MNKELEELIYDEDQAIDFIYESLSNEFKKSVTKDDIQYVLDVVYDYYESEGLIDEDTAEEASIDEEKMFTFILKAAKKDQVKLTEEAIALILEGEFQYGVSTGIYTAE